MSTDEMCEDQSIISAAQLCGWKQEGSLWREPDGTKAWAGGMIILRRWLAEQEAK